MHIYRELYIQPLSNKVTVDVPETLGVHVGKSLIV